MLKTILVFLSLIYAQVAISSEWIDFEWSQMTINDQVYDKAAIKIRVAESKLLQLDTGSPHSYLYAPAYDFEGIKKFTFELSQGNQLTSNFRVHETSESSDESIGTLGADYFNDGILVIDFPGQKLLKASNLDEAGIDQASVNFLNGNVTENFHIVTQTKVGDIEFSPVLFDTGSSIFTLVLNKTEWLKVVNSSDALNPPISMDVPAWGDFVRLYGAPSIEPICLGELCVKGDVYYTEDPKLDFSRAGLAGLMGNAILSDSHVLILDYKNKRVGTYKKP